jgi:HlyD family secretion protein
MKFLDSLKSYYQDNKKASYIIVTIFLISSIGGYSAYIKKKTALMSELYKGNGRIEAVEIYIATKNPGRLKDVLVKEGDFVTKDQILAIMDTDNLQAQLRQAKADFNQAKANVTTAQSQIELRAAEVEAAVKRQKRSAILVKEGASSQQEADDDKTRVESTEAALATTKAKLVGTKAAVESAQATIDRLQTDLNDCSLKAPRSGRIQYIISHPGEVLGGGGRILNLLDLTDVYMTFFMPTDAAGKISIGAEVRLVLDAIPQYVIPAKVSFVASDAQFTPKTVETANEREKLMFKVKANINPDLLKAHIDKVKTGLPGVAYIKLESNAEWPDKLKTVIEK